LTQFRPAFEIFLRIQQVFGNRIQIPGAVYRYGVDGAVFGSHGKKVGDGTGGVVYRVVLKQEPGRLRVHGDFQVTGERIGFVKQAHGFQAVPGEINEYFQIKRTGVEENPVRVVKNPGCVGKMGL